MKLKSMYGDKKTGKILFEAGILIMVVNLLCAIGIWQSISNGWKVSQGGELFFQAFIKSGGKYRITYLNQESIYISFLSVLFSFLGNKEELVSIINLILQLAGAGFYYLGAKKLFRFVFPLAVAVICGILSGCFYPVIADSSMHMIWFLCGLIFWMIAKIFSDMTGFFLKHILSGILLGIFCYIDMAGFFLLVIWILFTLITKEYSLKEKGLQLLCFFLSGINGYFCMFYLWNNFLFDSVVFQQWFHDKIKHLKLENGLDQYISLIIVLVVCIIFYIIKRSGNTVTVSTKELDNVFQQIVEQEEKVFVETTNENKIASEVENEFRNNIENMIKNEFENNIEFKNENEHIPEREVPKPIKFIENPLPLPKKHVKKEMNYAFEPSSDQMHYDLNNYRFDDDYDLKDS